MAKIKGVCKNIGEACSKALNREAQEVEKGSPFVCEECGKPLIEDKKSTGAGGTGKGKIVSIAIACVALLSVAGGYFFLSDKPDGPPLPPPPSVIESISVSDPNIELAKDGSKTLSLQILPADADVSGLVWSVADQSVVTLSGETLTAVAEGETTVTVKDSKGTATATWNVTVKDISTTSSPTTEGQVKEPEDVPVSPTGKIAYGTWTGGTKNGKPHGSQITFTFTAKHQIDSRDPKARIAEVGDYVIGEYINGSLVQGRWYKKAGGFESIIIGKAVGN